jgi:hypothetical protein
MRFLLVLHLGLAACTPKFVTPPTVPPGEARVELQPLPPDALAEMLPEGIPDDNRVEALEEKDKAPFAGVLVGEGVAARHALLRARYPELRVRYEQDRKVWAAHRELYETRLHLADKAIHDLQPSWWDRNAFSLGLLGGISLGVLTGVAAAAASN